MTFLLNIITMHEFSIVMNIIEIAEEEAHKAKASSITSLKLDVGTMAGIEFYALETALDMAVKNTMMENTDVIINKIPAVARCSNCGYEFNIKDITDECPKCKSLFSEVISGKEMKISSLTVEQ